MSSRPAAALVTRLSDFHDHERHPGPFPADRRCTHGDCITVLTRWNPWPWCFTHQVHHLAEIQTATAPGLLEAA